MELHELDLFEPGKLVGELLRDVRLPSAWRSVEDDPSTFVQQFDNLTQPVVTDEQRRRELWRRFVQLNVSRFRYNQFKVDGHGDLDVAR